MNKEFTYDQGVLLSAAPARFSKPGVWEAFLAAEKREMERLKEPSTQMAEDTANLPQSWRIPLTLLSDMAELNGDKRKLLFTAERQVISRLIQGSLIAFGYSVPRSPSDDPRHIPTDVWRGKIDWKNSSVTGNGLHFFAVRVFEYGTDFSHPNLIKDIRALPRDETPLGRPSEREPVLEVFELLAEQGLIDFSAPKVRACKPIRHALVKKFPTEARRYSVLGDDTIRRHISEAFDLRAEKLAEKLKNRG